MLGASFSSDSTPLCILLFVTGRERILLQRTLNSIQQQSSSQWKLYIIYPAQDANYYQSIVEQFSTIQYQLLFSNLPPHKIAQQVEGKHILFLSTGDGLHRNFILSFYKSLKKYPLIRLFYTDHQIQATAPHFKPDWNPDYLTSFNYIGHPVIFNRKDLLNINKLDMQNKKNYFHQLLIQVGQLYKSNQIYHHPTLLVRLNKTDEIIHETLLAPYFENNKRVYHEAFSIPQPAPLVSIIIPTKNQFQLLKQCIKTLLEKTSYPNFELLIIDNKSKDAATIDYLKQLKFVENITVLSYPHGFNYAAINNFAVKHAKGSLIAFLNNDTEITDAKWLSEMVKHACRSEIGCVGAKLIYPDETIQHGGVILGIYGTASHAHKHFPRNHRGYFNRLKAVHNVSAVTAACLVMRKEIFKQVGGFDQKNLKVAYNDVDLCLKILVQGYRNVWTPHAELIHHESKSRGKKRSWWQRRKLKKEAQFLKRKWAVLLSKDPAYNPNLTLEREDFSLK